MSTTAKTQDLPPPGGYRPITFARIPAKTYFRGSTIILGYIGMTAGAMYLYSLNYRQVHQEELEQRSSSMAITPLLLAERDRAFLKQLRLNRDEEADLMKNVKGWKVGTYYGEPIFHTLPEDHWWLPKIQEYYIHSRGKEYGVRANFSFWM